MTRVRNAARPVEIARGIEIGHIFQLGRKYADARPAGARRVREPRHGDDGLLRHQGVTSCRRVLEQHPATKGLVWPREVAPADLHVIATGKDDAVFDFATMGTPREPGRDIRVLFDDRRGVSPGVKFNDSELIGVPTIVVVGRGLARRRGRSEGSREW